MTKTRKPYVIRSREEGRGKATSQRFATLEAASQEIQAHWQGIDYVDHATDFKAGFHTDYSTFELIGFKLSDVGKYTQEDWGIDFRFHDLTEPQPIPAEHQAEADAQTAAHVKQLIGRILGTSRGLHFVARDALATLAEDQLVAIAQAVEARVANAQVPF